MEIRIESLNKDHSHSWVRISHGLNRLVTNLNNNEQDDNEQETSEMQFEDYALKSNAPAFSSRSKANAKPQRRISASSSWVKRFVRFVDRFYSVYSFRRETSRRIYVLREETDKKSANIQARSFLSKTLDVIGKKCPAEGEAKVVT